jgi:hypothetical protein
LDDVVKVLAIPASFPIYREERFLTRRNRLGDGVEYRTPEQAERLCRWELDLSGRSDAEVGELERFFQSVGGQYESFVFLDSLDNLLSWSEDFAQSAWRRSDPSQLLVVAGASDPLGGNAARSLVNIGPVAHWLSQELAAPPAGLQFTASIWLRSAPNMEAALALSDGATAIHSIPISPAPEWRRYSLTAAFDAGSTGTGIVFRLDVAPGATVDAFGAQLVALPSPGAYVRTAANSGFHPHCRFATSAFQHRLAGFGHSDVRLSIVEFA